LLPPHKTRAGRKRLGERHVLTDLLSPRQMGYALQKHGIEIKKF
jgi:hypothetical protein